MKKLYLTAVITVPSEEGQKRIDEALEKVCTLCNKQKPISSFNKEKLGKDGLTSRCRDCISDLGKIYREKINKENNIVSNKIKLSNKVGKSYITSEGYVVEVLECVSYNNCTIRFEDGLILHNINFNCIKKGNIKNPYHKSIYNVGFIGIGKYKRLSDDGSSTCFNYWCNTIERGYSKKLKEKQPSYKNCTVNEHWHNFQNFAEWFYKNWKPYMKGWHIDKDILVKGNKIYSSETCCFVPIQINCLFVKNEANRGDYVIGVSFYKGRYRAFINKNSERPVYLGTFDTPEEAFQAYKTEKEKYIKEVADKWKNLISDQVYKAMYNYKVEITD